MNGSSGTAWLCPWPGKVPGDHVEDVGELLGTPAPERRGGGAQRRAEHQQRQLGAVGGSGEPDRGDGRDAHSVLLVVVVGAGEHLVDDLAGGAEVVARVAAGLPVEQLGDAALLRRERGACCLTSAAIRAVSTCRPSSSSAACEAARQGVPGQGGQRRPLGVPAPVGPLVHGRRGREVQLGGRDRGRPAPRDGSAPRARGWPSAASSRSHRVRGRRARPARRSRVGPAAVRRWRCGPSRRWRGPARRRTS